MRRRGSPADGRGLWPVVHVEAAAVIQGGWLTKDVREGEKKDKRASREFCEDRMRPEWGMVLRPYGCRVFLRAHEGMCR